MRSVFGVAVAFGLLASIQRPAAAGETPGTTVELKPKGDTLEILIDGSQFAVYNFAKSQPKPYFWPVRNSDGVIITRPLVQSTDRPKPDHPHHRGIWFAVDEVNKVKFWAERGKIQNVSVEPITAKGNPAQFKVVNNWLGRDGQPLLIETTTISICANRLIGYDAQLVAAKEPVTFGDTKEGFFGFRMVSTMHEPMRSKGESAGGGKVANAEGLHGSSKCWGKTSDWVDYYGPVENRTVGVAIFDNPKNFRRSRYHVRNYGLFSISPFGEKDYTLGKNPAAPLTLKPGEKLRLRYALYVHNGDTAAGNVAGVYREYLKSAGG